MAIILFDNSHRGLLLPFTVNRAVASFRFGIFSIRERWEKMTGEKVYVHTEKYLQGLYEVPEEGEHTWVDASLMGGRELVTMVKEMKSGTGIVDDKGLIAGKAVISFEKFDPAAEGYFARKQQHTPVRRLEYPWQIPQWNAEIIQADFELVTRAGSSQGIPATVNAVQPENIFIEEGAKLDYCIINASAGPVYIGKNAEIMEGTAIRGPFVLGEHAVLKMCSRIYGATSLGPYCLGGGEIKNSVMMGFSNKIHDGYLGDSVVGEWCNLGSGTSNSNIKNTAGEIKMELMATGETVSAGFKCGVMIGDYTRTAINSSINTGSVIGIAGNIFGTGFLPRLIRHFSWGTVGGTYQIEKAIQDIANWKKMKNGTVSEAEKAVLKHIFASHYGG